MSFKTIKQKKASAELQCGFTKKNANIKSEDSWNYKSAQLLEKFGNEEKR